MKKKEKNQSIKVSVIVPIYNTMPYLQECLDSVCGQTLQDIEIIAIDDGSTDGSYELLLLYAQRDERIIPIKNPYNIGAARTRNIGIQLARGDYLAILDADDFFDIDFLEKMYQKIMTDTSDVVICNVAVYDNDTGHEIYRTIPYFLLNRLSKKFNFKDISNHIFNFFWEVPHNKLYRKSFLLDYQIYFQDLENSNDVYFGGIVLVLANTLSYINRRFVHYRKNWGGNIQAIRGKNPLCVFWALRKLYDNILSKGCWKDCSRSFYKYSMNIIMNSLILATAEILQDVIDFWRNEGFQRIGMTNLTKENFGEQRMFQQWKELYNSGRVLLTPKISYHEGIATFIEGLKKEEFNAAIWGYGKIGHIFKHVADTCGYPIFEIYEIDESKWGCSDSVRVCGFEQRNEMVDTIVITVMKEYGEIAKYIHKQTHCIRVLALEPYLTYGATIEECELP